MCILLTIILDVVLFFWNVKCFLQYTKIVAFLLFSVNKYSPWWLIIKFTSVDDFSLFNDEGRNTIVLLGPIYINISVFTSALIFFLLWSLSGTFFWTDDCWVYKIDDFDSWFWLFLFLQIVRYLSPYTILKLFPWLWILGLFLIIIQLPLSSQIKQFRFSVPQWYLKWLYFILLLINRC